MDFDDLDDAIEQRHIARASCFCLTFVSQMGLMGRHVTLRALCLWMPKLLNTSSSYIISNSLVALLRLKRDFGKFLDAPACSPGTLPHTFWRCDSCCPSSTMSVLRSIALRQQCGPHAAPDSKHKLPCLLRLAGSTQLWTEPMQTLATQRPTHKTLNT